MTVVARPYSVDSIGAVSIDAVSIDAVLLTDLGNRPTTGTVHSTFEHVVNVTLASGQLLSLATRPVDDAPNTIRVDRESWSALAVAVGDLVEFDDHRLVLPAAVIDLANATSWDPSATLHIDTAPTSDWIRTARRELEEIVTLFGSSGGMYWDAHRGEPIAELVVSMLLDGSDRLIRALADGDLVDAEDCVGQLLGLGPGLTPSGDDYLLGLSAVTSSSAMAIHEHQQFFTAVFEWQAWRTNVLSGVSLREAAAGRCRESISALLAVLAAGDDDLSRLRDAARDVLNIGATSGTDILVGVIAALELELMVRSSHE